MIKFKENLNIYRKVKKGVKNDHGEIEILRKAALKKKNK